MKSVTDILTRLNARARPEQLEGMSRFGIVGEKRLGVSIPDLRKIAREIGKNHELALKLWATGFQDARILAAMVDDPEKVSKQQMENWVKDINSWDVCDQVCMNLFEKVDLVRKKIENWSQREEEFVKRTAFSLIACLAWHDKEASDQEFINLLPIIKSGANDERNYVKKAVNWALRNIGKRNLNLNRMALKTAREIRQMDYRSASWIASDAIRELRSEKVQKRLAEKARRK